MLAIAPLLLALTVQDAQAADVRVTGTQFFAIDTRGDPPDVVESSTIPYRPETSCFGWVISVEPAKGEVSLREELRLPAPARSWGTAEGITVHPDRAGATSRLTEDLDDGILSNEWCLSEGDPTGAHQISVYHGDRLLHRFEFTMLEPPRAI